MSADFFERKVIEAAVKLVFGTGLGFDLIASMGCKKEMGSLRAAVRAYEAHEKRIKKAEEREKRLKKGFGRIRPI